jgi:hypothetical protein
LHQLRQWRRRHRFPPIDPARIEQLRLDAPVEATNPRSVLSSSLQDATGRQQVVVRLA